MSKRIALLDLDTPIFKACSVVEKRSVLVTHKETGIQKEFSNKTEFKNLLSSKNKSDKISEYTIEDIQEAEPIENALHILRSHLNSIFDYVWPDEVIYMLSGRTNFRNDLPLPKKYKSNRTGVRPLLLKEAKKRAWKKYNAIVTENSEPDDYQIWMGYEILKNGDIPIIITGDKDAKAYTGLHLFNPDHPEHGIEEIPALGNIEEDSKGKVRANGMMQYGLQMLIGDAIDGYSPTEICNVRFGEKSALKLLHGCKTEQEVLQCVIDKYKQWYPEDFTYTAWDGKKIDSNWKHMLNLYHSCVRMQEVKDDPLIAFDFYKRFNINLV